MALQALNGGLWIPMQKALGASALATNVYVMDATGEYVAMVIRAPKGGNLQGFECMVGAVGNVLDNGTTFSFQDVDLTTGLPDLVRDQFVTTAASTPAAAGWYNPGNFNATRAVSRGDLVAMVIENPTFTAGDSLSISHLLAAVSGLQGFPYGVNVTGTKQLQSVPVFALRYDDSTYGFLGSECWAISSIGTWTANTGTTPDEVGLAFTLPFPARLSSVMFTGSVAASADWDIVLYDSSSNVLATQSCDDDVTGSTGSIFHSHTFDAAVELAGGSLYRVALKPTTANSITLPYGVFNSLPLMDTVEGGQAFYGTSRTDAGSWTNYNNGTDGYRRPRMYLRFDAFDDGQTGGGMTLLGTGGLIG